jgi:hypothetical protein
MKYIPINVKKWIGIGTGGLIGIFLVWLFLQQPSHNRDWEIGQEKLPYMFLDNGVLTIENFRNFYWYNGGDADITYEMRTFDFDKMETVDVFISHFDEFEGLAHIFVSFGFSDGEYVVISLETRRERNEEFSPFWGMLRQFEIIYVVGSERDIVGLRTDVRDERIYLYETIATPERARALFLQLMYDVNAVYETPKIYNTLMRNCTNEITRRVEDISEVDFPLTWKMILPGYFDEVLYDMELIDTQGDFYEVKLRHHINNSAVNRNNPQYSRQLRQSFSSSHMIRVPIVK